LNWVGRQRGLNRPDELNVSQVLLHPAADAQVEFLHAFHYQRAFIFAIKGEDNISAEVVHRGAEVTRRRGRQQVAMEELTARGLGSSAVGGDEP